MVARSVCSLVDDVFAHFFWCLSGLLRGAVIDYKGFRLMVTGDIKPKTVHRLDAGGAGPPLWSDAIYEAVEVRDGVGSLLQLFFLYFYSCF